MLNAKAKIFSIMAMPASLGVTFALAYYLPPVSYAKYSLYAQYMLLIGIPLSSLTIHSLRHDYQTRMFRDKKLLMIAVSFSAAVMIIGVIGSDFKFLQPIIELLSIVGIAIATATQESSLAFLEKNDKAAMQLYIRSSSAILQLLLVSCAFCLFQVKTLLPVLYIILASKLISSYISCTACIGTNIRPSLYQKKMKLLTKIRVYGIHTLSSFSSMLLICISYIYFVSISELSTQDSFAMALLFLTIPLGAKLSLILNIENINATSGMICSAPLQKTKINKVIRKYMLSSLLISVAVSLLFGLAIFAMQWIKFPDTFMTINYLYLLLLILCLFILEGYAASITGLLQRCGIVNFTAQFLAGGVIINALIYFKIAGARSPVGYLLALNTLIFLCSIVPSSFILFSAHRPKCTYLR